MPVPSKFSGPIEDIVFKTCPGASYCSIDQCFRNGETCGNDGKCCLTSSSAQDLVKSLGCGGITNFTSQPSQQQKLSTLSEDPTALNTCSIQLGLSESDRDYMCRDLDNESCFKSICNLGCVNSACPGPSPSNINLQNQVCRTIQQYCDVLDPSLLSDPNYKELCCSVDYVSGVKNRTVCGCPGNPCNTNPIVLQNVQAIKTKAEQYWKDNQPVAPVVQQPISIESSESNVNIKLYLLIICSIILLIGTGLYWYFVYRKKSSYYNYNYSFSQSDNSM